MAEKDNITIDYFYELRHPLETRIREYLDAEEKRCHHKISTLGDISTIGRCAQSRLHLIEKIRAIITQEG